MVKCKHLNGNVGDLFKWFFVVFLISAGFVVDYLYPSIAWAIKSVIMLFVVVVCGFVIVNTVKGKQWLMFAKHSMVELNKVTWPQRQESVQTTLVVLVFVVFSAFLLWVMDAVLAGVVRYLSS